MPTGAMCVQNFDESRICNSHYVSHFAAFFIDARAKRSIAESCLYFLFTFLLYPTLYCSQEKKS